MEIDYYNQGEPREYDTKDGRLTATLLQPTERQFTKLMQVMMAETPKEKFAGEIKAAKARAKAKQDGREIKPEDLEPSDELLIEVSLASMVVSEWQEFAAKRHITGIRRKDGTPYTHKGKDIQTGGDLVEFGPKDYVDELVEEVMAEGQMSDEEKKSSGDSSSSRAMDPSNGTAESVHSTTPPAMEGAAPGSTLPPST